MLLLFVFVFYILCLFHLCNLIVFCFNAFTGFDKINHDVHLECMSIVTDATQNQNGSTLTKSEIMVFLPEVALVNLSKRNNGILARSSFSELVKAKSSVFLPKVALELPIKL